MDRSRLAALVRELARSSFRPSALRRTEEIIAALGASRSVDVVPMLLPVLVVRAWPATSAPVDLRDRTRLGDAAVRALEHIVASHSTRDAIGVDMRLRWISEWARLEEWGYLQRWVHVEPEDVASLEAASASPTTLLGALSGHPSGYVRERAVARLIARGDRALRWLLVRALDWVQPVRDRALRAIEASLSDADVGPDLIEVLPLVQRLRGFTRVNALPVVQKIVDRLATEPDAVLDGGLMHPDRYVRRATLDLLAETGRLRSAHIEVALADHDVGVRVRAARSLEADRTPEGARLRAMLSADPSARLRARGLELLAEADAAAALPFLWRAVDDEARGVRERARNLLARHAPIDFRAHYLWQLEDHATRGAVLGLGEVGGPEDWERLVPALDARPPIARAAIASLRRLNRSATRELRLMMVDDERPGVSADAARSLVTDVWATDEPVLGAYLRSPHLHVRRKACGLATQLPGWRPAVLLLSVDDEGARLAIEAALGRWLRRRWAQRARPSEAEAARLEALLTNTTMLDEPVRESALRLLALDRAP